MHLTCPHCGAGYEVPDARVSAGRRVRCAQCAQVWTVEPEPVPAASEAPLPDAPPPIQPDGVRPGETQADMPAPRAEPPPPGSTTAMEQLRARPAELPKSRGGVLAGWLLTAVVLAAAGWAGVTYREQIMRAWPPSTRAYAALGLIDARPPR